MKKIICASIVYLLIIGLSGCTTKTINPISKKHHILHICIQSNPKVIVGDFIPVVEDVFQNHNITTEIYYKDMPNTCKVKLTYTALQSWDFTLYLSHAEIRVYKEKQRIGYAEFHEVAGGMSLSLNKWASVKNKMTPILNDLLIEYK